jgi:hypothetical protein
VVLLGPLLRKHERARFAGIGARICLKTPSLLICTSKFSTEKHSNGVPALKAQAVIQHRVGAQGMTRLLLAASLTP